MRGRRTIAAIVGAIAPVALLAGCGGAGGGEAGAAVGTAAPAGTVAFVSGTDPVVGTVADASSSGGGEGASLLGGPSPTNDEVHFVTTTSTTTTTTEPPTTTRPSTTTSTTTSTMSATSTTSSTSTSTTVPTSIRCSFAADALFEPGSAALTPTATAMLVELVTGVDDVRIVRIEGHTDHRGRDDENMTLSQARADAAKAALVAAGVDERIVTAVGLGETEANQQSPTDAEMAADRRVDVVIDATVAITTSC